MGILDPVQKHLASDVWTLDRKIRPPVRDWVLNRAKQLLGPIPLHQAFVLGSITGFKYKETSDLDVNLIIPEQFITETFHDRRKSFNGMNLPGTQHPVNFFVQRVPPDGSKMVWEDVKFGVYDLLEDRWASSPGDYRDVKKPGDQFALELVSASMIKRKYVRLLNKFKDALDRIKKAKKSGSQSDLKYGFKLYHLYRSQLVELVTEVDEERKFEYEMGWGTPRENWRNVVYKMLENYDEDVFHTLNEMD